MIFINTQSDKQVDNFTDFCKHAWKDAGSVNVAFGQDATLRIVPICVDKSSHKLQSFAVVLYDVTAGGHGNYADSYSTNVTAGFGREKPKNVTCFVDTSWGKTYQHVFTSPLSDTPVGNLCSEQKVFSAVTRNPDIENQTILYTARTVPIQPGRRPSLHAGHVTLLAVVGVTLVGMLPACLLLARKKGYCLRDNQAAQVAHVSVGSPLSIASLNHWVISGPSSHAVTVSISQGTSGPDRATGSVPQGASYSGDEQHYNEIPDEYFYKYENADTSPHGTSNTYWEIPDDYFNYYNLRPASLHHYWEIGDEYYNYENTTGRPLSFPLALQVPLSSGQDDDVDNFPFNTSSTEAALPTGYQRAG
ncbi:PREDICTED: uncharacterized protein LOC109481485 [Branchiostoma belcheri]|uniref:Uncharacterized protein LOC109481485 n=1 Tax=Branchiostoma belcheri TaxID=7741 RepID=A0A6P4ZEB1_BRABE|nr:PREDICTED: uncharacterized protein LOC109481485 [Branchiostoma belcheri]